MNLEKLTVEIRKTTQHSNFRGRGDHDHLLGEILPFRSITCILESFRYQYVGYSFAPLGIRKIDSHLISSTLSLAWDTASDPRSSPGDCCPISR